VGRQNAGKTTKKKQPAQAAAVTTKTPVLMALNNTTQQAQTAPRQWLMQRPVGGKQNRKNRSRAQQEKTREPQATDCPAGVPN